MKKSKIVIGTRKIGPDYPPFIIAEIGINHEGDIKKAKKMIRDAASAGAECVKFQRHVIEDEMTPDAKENIPGNANTSIWEIMKRCSLTHKQHAELKKYCEKLGLIYLCTPFSRAAVDSLAKLKVAAFKIGSGECNNYPLIKHIASFKKPVILSTGMNDLRTIRRAVKILNEAKISHAILHCTSMYPTPYEKVRLGAINILEKTFPRTVVGLSDHSIGNYTSFAAVSMGASIIEKHFTSNKKWKGPDVSISINPKELQELIEGTKAIHQSLGGKKDILKEEKVTINFAYASVVSIRDIKKGEKFTKTNIWVKRPGTGEILAEDFEKILSKVASCDIAKDIQIKRKHVKN
jgi:N-acetylneuraminate synthase